TPHEVARPRRLIRARLLGEPEAVSSLHDALRRYQLLEEPRALDAARDLRRVERPEREEEIGELVRARRLPVEPGELALEHRAERAEVERLLEALAERLERDRELGEARGDGEEVLRPLPLDPERRPLPGEPPRNEQSARGAFAEARGEERALAERGEHEL